MLDIVKILRSNTSMPCYEFVCEGHIFIVSSLGRIMLVEMLSKGYWESSSCGFKSLTLYWHYNIINNVSQCGG